MGSAGITQSRTLSGGTAPHRRPSTKFRRKVSEHVKCGQDRPGVRVFELPPPSLTLSAAGQCCRVHFTSNALALVNKVARDTVCSAVRSILEQPDEKSPRPSCTASPTACGRALCREIRRWTDVVGGCPTSTSQLGLVRPS